ncbi:MAG: glycosyltransferase family 2 protein [Chitinophagaceae bacterium]|nr:glycosyltransferase family 2 protein [Chitinophagaceae bacterium]
MSDTDMNEMPWASFCMSTYKRPGFLKTQIESLLQQTFRNFEIVISDNDPDASGKAIVETFNDLRVKYFPNGENLGMVKSFNKSIDRARSEFIVMVTDDDPVDPQFLSFVHGLVKQYPGHSLYAGFKRKGKREEEVELLNKNVFLREILDTGKTTKLLWSSCLLRKEALVKIGKLADYGGGHLVDHAMISMTGSINGGVVVNKMYSDVVLHETNYTKSNLPVYPLSCIGFYNLVSTFCKENNSFRENEVVIKKHLHKWFIDCMFNLRRFYSAGNIKDQKRIKEVDSIAKQIMEFPFMKNIIPKYKVKYFIFWIKMKLGMIK